MKKKESSEHSRIEKANISLQSNIDSSNDDGSFIMANSNSFLCHCEILPIAQEKK